MLFSQELGVASRSDATVLITGPTGAGKTWLARRIHESGPRASGPFVTVNLATLHEGVLESELFGHERGAFTGAASRRQGRLALAEGGTVFLDEIGELGPRLQGRLLEFLQSRVICPVGGNLERRLNVRVIAATNRDLEADSREGRFRSDLFHRLRVVSIGVPGLAQRRPEELRELASRCLAELAAAAGRASPPLLSDEAAERFSGYPWPGNLRELRNVLEYAVHACGPEGAVLLPSHLPGWFTRGAEAPAEARAEAHEAFTARDSGAAPGPAAARSPADIALNDDYFGTVLRFEREYLIWALNRHGGRVNETARRIGINKTTLIRRMRAYGLRVEPAPGRVLEIVKA